MRLVLFGRSQDSMSLWIILYGSKGAPVVQTVSHAYHSRKQLHSPLIVFLHIYVYKGFTNIMPLHGLPAWLVNKALILQHSVESRPEDFEHK